MTTATATTEGGGEATGRGHAKVILIGEHAVVYGHAALAAGLSVGVAVRARPGSGKLRVPAWGLEAAAGDDSPVGRALGAILRRLEAPALDFDADADVPARAGLGSSAALAVAIARAAAAACARSAALACAGASWRGLGGRYPPPGTSAPEPLTAYPRRAEAARRARGGAAAAGRRARRSRRRAAYGR